ncbi:MAG: Crp/Fnr family transcriptional regulator [Bacteroidota bacterium]
MADDRQIWEDGRASLYQTLSKSLRLTDDQLTEFVDLWQPKEFAKGEPIIRTGQYERHFHFVLDGVMRMLYNSPEGDEYTLAFSFAGEWSGHYPSLLFDQPATVDLECLTEVKCLSIRAEDLLASYDKWMELEKWGHRFVTRVLHGRLQREIELLQFSAQERLERFCKRSGHLFLEIPHKYIAAYLKMSPETLSRLRSAMTIS